MKYDHMVKVNGKYYAAGENVPYKAVEEALLPLSNKNITFQKKTKEKRYTKTDIMKMSKAELYEMAKKTDAENIEEMSRVELVKYLLSIFKL